MYQRTEDGKAINPPVIPDYERQIYGVMEQDPGNARKIQRLTDEYEKARQKLADEEDQDERDRDTEQRTADAALRDAARAASDPPPNAAENQQQDDSSQVIG